MLTLQINSTDTFKNNVYSYMKHLISFGLIVFYDIWNFIGFSLMPKPIYKHIYDFWVNSL